MHSLNTYHTVKARNVQNEKVLSQKQCDITGIQNGRQKRDARPSRRRLCETGTKREPAVRHRAKRPTETVR